MTIYVDLCDALFLWLYFSVCYDKSVLNQSSANSLCVIYQWRSLRLNRKSLFLSTCKQITLENNIFTWMSEFSWLSVHFITASYVCFVKSGYRIKYNITLCCLCCLFQYYTPPTPNRCFYYVTLNVQSSCTCTCFSNTRRLQTSIARTLVTSN